MWWFTNRNLHIYWWNHWTISFYPLLLFLDFYFLLIYMLSFGCIPHQTVPQNSRFVALNSHRWIESRADGVYLYFVLFFFLDWNWVFAVCEIWWDQCLYWNVPVLIPFMAVIRMMILSGIAAVDGLDRVCYLLKSVGVDRLRFLFCSAAATAFTSEFWVALLPIKTVVPSLLVLLLPLGCCWEYNK